MTWNKLFGCLLFVFFGPSLVYEVCYLAIRAVGIKNVPALIESFILEAMTLGAILYIFKFYKKGALQQLNTQVFSLKKALLLIPLSLLVRVPTALIFIIIESLNLFPFLSQSLNDGVKFQWSDLATPTGFGIPVDLVV